MEQKKDSNWDERHPMGNLRYYTFVDGFANVTCLNELATRSALRVLKRQLENCLGFELTDDAFIAIFFKVINLGPARPLGAWSFQYGFVVPMQKLLTELNLHCGVNEIFSFFNVRNYDERRYHNILLHIPHSSIIFPDEIKTRFDDLDYEERLLIDYYTDELFVPTQEDQRISSVVFPYCRLYCDVERLINDPLEKEGLGISYSRWVDKDEYNQILRSFSSIQSAFKLYADFHTEASMKLLKKSGSKLVIDCHSFSSIPNLLNRNPPSDIDICIGYNEDVSCPNKTCIGNIVQYFKSKGYKVGINSPFSNSKTFPVPTEYHSVMIEINKKLYMDEVTLKKNEQFTCIHQDLQSLYKMLLKQK